MQANLLRNTFIGGALALSMLLVGGCQKGEDDPLLSFRSRKNRMVGEWTVVESKTVMRETDPSFEFSTTTTVKDGRIVIDREFSNGPVEDLDASIDYNTYEFDDEGGFVHQLKYRYQRTAFINARPFPINGEYTLEERGTWDFLGATEGYKNRERVQLLTTSRTTITFEFGSGLNDSIPTNEPDIWELATWDLSRLSHKEIIASAADESQTTTTAITSNEAVVATRSTDLEITLKQ
ncbi:MAG: hypothetical protein ACFB10_14440 [Salibacteraceae bacterium]